MSDSLNGLKEFMKSPSEVATSKLFTLLLAENIMKAPREFAFALDTYTNASADNMQIFIDTMYNSAPSNPDEIAATTTLHMTIVPALFRAVEYNGTLVSSEITRTENPLQENDSDHPKEDCSKQNGIAGANGVMYFGGKETPQEADPEVAHRLICALLRPPSTWLVDRRVAPNNMVQASTWKLLVDAVSSVFVPNSAAIGASNEPGSELRMKLLLEYARCTCCSFSTPAHGTTLANAFGAIIGSLQGTDVHSPEVAVVVACLNMLCDHLRKEDLLRAETVRTGLEVLTIALELVPGTALLPVWEMMAALVQESQQREMLVHTLAKNVNQMENASRRSVVTRMLLRMYPPVVKSKL